MLKEIGDMWSSGLYRKGQDLKLFNKLNTHWYADSELLYVKTIFHLITPMANLHDSTKLDKMKF